MITYLDERDLRNQPSLLRERLASSEAVAVVSNGVPRALLLKIDGEELLEVVALVHGVRAKRALARLRAGAAERGMDRLGEAEVESEIAAARAIRY